MSSSGYLVHPSIDPSREQIWTETWKRIDRFLPDLRKELDLDPKIQEKPVVVEEKVVDEKEVDEKSVAASS
jgi:brefeldin A-resistance guanine nucleotide exchange factor 1